MNSETIYEDPFGNDYDVDADVKVESVNHGIRSSVTMKTHQDGKEAISHFQELANKSSVDHEQIMVDLLESGRTETIPVDGDYNLRETPKGATYGSTNNPVQLDIEYNQEENVYNFTITAQNMTKREISRDFQRELPEAIHLMNPETDEAAAYGTARAVLNQIEDTIEEEFP